MEETKLYIYGGKCVCTGDKLGHRYILKDDETRKNDLILLSKKTQYAIGEIVKITGDSTGYKTETTGEFIPEGTLRQALQIEEENEETRLREKKAQKLARDTLKNVEGYTINELRFLAKQSLSNRLMVKAYFRLLEYEL